MENEVRSDLKISGAGSALGGRFNNVNISGSANINGDLDCNSFNTSGSSKVNGNIKTKGLVVSGSSKIKGNIEAEELKINGSVDIEGNVKSEGFKISGRAKINGNLSAQKISISGGINISKDCEAEEFNAHGSFEIGGLLNAGTIKVKTGGRCYAKEIGGENIEIREHNSVLSIINKLINTIFSNFSSVTCDIVEGDNIYLENTIAKVVRGNNINIGTGCKIDLVEYKNELKVIDNGYVKERRKI